MQGDILIILVLIVVGVAAFFFGLIYVVCQLLAALGRGTVHLLAPRGIRRAATASPPRARPAGARTFRVCARPQCRHVEQRQALFCSQCGAKLADAD